MGIFGATKSKKIEMERNSLYFFWSKGYTLLDDMSSWADITEELKNITGEHFFVDIQGDKTQSFIMNRNDTWDLLNPAVKDGVLYRAEKDGEHIMFGVLNTACVTVMRIGSDFAKRTENEYLKHKNKITKKVTDFENDKELKECLGYKPGRFYVNY